MICSNICSCGLVSDSLSVSGSGGQGDPWRLEANAFGLVTSTTRPASPFNGQSIYETDTDRYVVYDGVNWVIMAGQFPGCSAYITAGTQIVATATSANVALPTEAYDIGGLHTGSNAFFTVPAGMAGDYMLTCWIRFSPGAVGQRTVLPIVTSNGSIVNGIPRSTTFPTEGTSNSGVSMSGTMRLVAGAVVTLQAYHTQAANLTLTDAVMTLDMIRHIPSLT